MNNSNNDSVPIGCLDFGTAEKNIVVYLGNANNGLAYNTLIESQAVTLYTSNSFLVSVRNTDVTKFSISKIDVFTNINAHGKYIYNLSPPLHHYDATTKGYVDGVVKMPCWINSHFKSECRQNWLYRYRLKPAKFELCCV